MSRRTIFCIDLDAFFVSVERLLRPGLEGRPVVVGGRPGSRGVVLAASYEARAYGVRSAMSLAEAGKRLRGARDTAWLEPSRAAYDERSAAVREALERDLPVLEAASIDEFYADVTPLESGDRSAFYGGRGPAAIAEHVVRRIGAECGLPASVGIASSKVVAKIATDAAKPRGILRVLPGREAAFLAGLPVERLPGVGPKTVPRLRAAGVVEIGDLERVGAAALERAVGRAHACWLLDAARGVDPSPVEEGAEARSIGHEATFDRDLSSQGEIEAAASDLAERVAWRLRAEGLAGRTVQVKIRYAERRQRFVAGALARDVWETVTRARSGEPLDDGRAIAAAARDLVREHWRRGEPIRLLGVSVRGLVPAAGRQGSLFDVEKSARSAKLTRVLDEVRGKFGFDAISWGDSRTPT